MDSDTTHRLTESRLNIFYWSVKHKLRDGELLHRIQTTS